MQGIVENEEKKQKDRSSIELSNQKSMLLSKPSDRDQEDAKNDAEPILQARYENPTKEGNSL